MIFSCLFIRFCKKKHLFKNTGVIMSVRSHLKKKGFHRNAIVLRQFWEMPVY